MSSLDDTSAVRRLYQDLLDCWNRRAASDYAGLFSDEGNIVGFDGSQVNGRAAIAVHLTEIFANHQTAAYVGKVREVRLLSPDVALLRAVVGMVPPGQSDVNPAVNAIQSLVAVKRDGRWQVELFHNTPAAFHGQPELSASLTEELRQVLRASQG